MDALTLSPAPLPAPDGSDEALFVPPLEILAPARQTLPLVLASPHSGSLYPASFVAQSQLDALTLRRSEDAFVHDLVASGPTLGAPLLHARFPRAWLDVNREPYELDPAMFDGPLPPQANTRSPRVTAGLGTIARMVATGADIYRTKLSVAEAEQRIAQCYHPYHTALADLVTTTRAAFGACILVDCHSMPSGAATPGVPAPAGAGVDFVLGDCHGISCARVVTSTARRVLEDHGFTVVRNTPYAGGFTTRHYGRPGQGFHALQIEINRRLYMDEATVTRRAGFAEVAAAMSAVIAALGALNPQDLCGL